MQRRTFIRLVGGGAVVAAGASLARLLARAYPPKPPAWNGPPAGADPGAGSSATPSSRRTRTTCSPGGRTCARRARSRSPATRPAAARTDPYSRQIMMSHGTFLEVLDLAAERGLRAEIELFPGASTVPNASTAGRWRASASCPMPASRGPALRARSSRGAPTAKLTTSRARSRRGPGPRWPRRRWRPPGCASATSALSDPARWRPPRDRRRGLAYRTRHATHDARVVQGAAARRCDGIAQHRDGLSLMDPMVVAMTRLRPLRPQQGAGARRLCGAQPDRAVRRQARRRRPASRGS